MQIASAVVFLIGSIALFVVSLGERGSLSYPLAYSQFLIAALIVLFAVVLTQIAWRRRSAEANLTDAGESASPSRAGFYVRPLAGLIACVIYVFSWNAVGHLPATILFLIAMLLIGGERKLLVIVAVTLGVGFLVNFVFVDLLSIPLPRIPWKQLGLSR